MRPHVLGLLPDALAAHLRAAGVPVRDDEARRLCSRRFSEEGDPRPVRPLSRVLLGRVSELTDDAPLEVVERVRDPQDGFVKYLFRARDGALFEAVRIPLHRPAAFSVCLSSQVGCQMGCDFCATGRLGFSRNLEAWEMVAQLGAVRRDVAAEGGRVTGAVFQGQGEPLANYDAVIAAARVLSHPTCGRIAGRNISISTVGLPAPIRRYAAEAHPYRLIVSLHSAVLSRRQRLLPVAGRASLAELADAIRAYATSTRDRVTIAWTLMGGENDGVDEARALGELLPGVPLRVNLIDVNDTREGGYRRATDVERKAFMEALQPLRAPIVRRYSGGAGTDAACGMLAARHQAPSRLS